MYALLLVAVWMARRSRLATRPTHVPPHQHSQAVMRTRSWGLPRLLSRYRGVGDAVKLTPPITGQLLLLVVIMMIMTGTSIWPRNATTTPNARPQTMRTTYR